MMIHISEALKVVLDEFGDFEMEHRGELEVKVSEIDYQNPQ